MAKKKRTVGRGPSADELIAMRTRVAQQWAYDRRLEHMSYREMRRRVVLDPEQGGLGYDISEPKLSRLVAAYFELMSEMTVEAPALQLERELHDLDANQRAIMAQLARDEANGIRLDASLLREYRAAGESRRKLLGTDASDARSIDEPDEAAVLVELNRALVALGMKPLER